MTVKGSLFEILVGRGENASCCQDRNYYLCLSRNSLPSMFSIQASQKFCCLLTLYQTTNLDSSELKEFALDNVKFVENGGKFSK